jgi:hypothetical protein
MRNRAVPRSEPQSSWWSTIPALANVAIATAVRRTLPGVDPAVGLEAIQFTVGRSTPLAAGKSRDRIRMRTVVVGRSRSRQAALRCDEAVDPPRGPL